MAVPTVAPAANAADACGLGETCTGALTGSLGDTTFQITMPEKFNGTVLLYSHGYRIAQPGAGGRWRRHWAWTGLRTTPGDPRVSRGYRIAVPTSATAMPRWLLSAAVRGEPARPGIRPRRSGLRQPRLGGCRRCRSWRECSSSTSTPGHQRGRRDHGLGRLPRWSDHPDPR